MPVTAPINPAWMRNQKIEDAINNLSDVKVERKKDNRGINLIGPLERIIQVQGKKLKIPY